MGEPLKKRIPLLVPHAPSADAILPYLRQLDRRRWYSNFGPLNCELERRLTDVPCTTVSSGTLALELALRATKHRFDGIGNTVLVPSFTYPATILAIVNAGGVPIFCDVDAKSWCMGPDAPRNSAAITLPVCSFGRNVDWTHFHIRENDAIVIDAAAAYSNQPPHEFLLTCYSLHATKYPGCGEGGFVAGNTELVESVRRLASFGMNVERACDLPFGTNAKLSEYHAAVALAALSQPKEKEYEDLEDLYVDALEAACPNIELQDMAGGMRTALPVLLPEGVNVEKIALYLDLQGIETRRWYFPLCHTMPAFKEFQKFPLPVSEDLSRRLIGLPYHLFLSRNDIADVCYTLARAIEGQGAKP